MFYTSVPLTSCSFPEAAAIDMVSGSQVKLLIRKTMGLKSEDGIIAFFSGHIRILFLGNALSWYHH